MSPTYSATWSAATPSVGSRTKWVRLETGDVSDLAQLPEATPTKMRAGINDLVVSIGDQVNALHAVCAHAGGPLPEGRVVDGCVECPWHGSRFRVSDGLARRGPTVYDQPAYEIRPVESGGYEARRLVVSRTDPPERGAASSGRCRPSRSRIRAWSCSSALPAPASRRSPLDFSGLDEIVSSDALRAVISGDEADQRVSGIASRSCTGPWPGDWPRGA